MDWGSVGEWVSGVGSLAAVVTALVIARDGRQMASADRAALLRARIAEQYAALISAVERDLDAGREGPNGVIRRSPEGRAMCHVLWGRRNSFGTVWSVYCGGEDLQPWINDLLNSSQLHDRMRSELQEALDALNDEDQRAITS